MSIDALHDLAANTGSNTSAPTSSTVSTSTNMPRAWPLGSPVSARRGAPRPLLKHFNGYFPIWNCPGSLSGWWSCAAADLNAPEPPQT
jgi:hypothetical protein